MQSRVAIISLVVAIVLGLLTAIAYRTPRGSSNSSSTTNQSTQSTPTPLARLDPIAVSKIEVVDASGTLLRTIQRTDLGWIASSDNTINWPVDSGQPRGLARLVSDAAKQPIVDAPEPQNAITLKLTADSGTPIEIVISPTALAGSTLIFEKIPGGKTIARKASGDWNALLSKSSLDAWRSRRPLAVQSDTTKSITIESGSREMTLARTDGAWRMTAPKPVNADADATNKLIEGLAAVTAERFVESGSSLAAIEKSFETPAASVTVTSTIPGTATKGDIEQHLVVGGPADASGSLFFARVTAVSTWDKKTLWGPVTVVLTRQAIESLVQDPAGYVSKRSVQVPSADVTKIGFVHPPGYDYGSVNDLVRLESGWGFTYGNSNVPPQPLKSEEAPLSMLATLLCDTPASAVVFDKSQLDKKLLDSYWHFITFVLYNKDGKEIAWCRAGRMITQSGKMLLVIENEQHEVWRIYESSVEPDTLIAPLIKLYDTQHRK